jgi:small subunit ribosomal protein S21
MLIIKVNKSENIDKVLKRFKRKFRETKILQELRSKKHFEKKSTKRRLEIKNAIYTRIKKEENEE